MARKLIISADDVGLSKSNTDSIFEAVDHGALTSVSILANGEAVEYAVEGYIARSDRLRIALHVNVTEGKSLSSHEVIPLLTHQDGMFRYSPLGLWIAYAFSSLPRKHAFALQVRTEIQAQWDRVREMLATAQLPLFAADGHQHVQVIPFVFDALVTVPGLKEVRIPQEPFYTAPGGIWAHFTPHGVARLLFNIFGKRLRRRIVDLQIKSSDYFLGLLYSGTMTYGAVEHGLVRVSALGGDSVEILLHPGSAKENELTTWKMSHANIAWHYSPWRAREQALLVSSNFQSLIHTYTFNYSTSSIPAYTFTSRFFRFFFSGSIAAVTTLLLLYVFTEWLHLWYVLSATLAYSVSIAVSFILQKYWTFRETSAPGARQLSVFILMNIFNATANAACLYILVDFFHVWYLVAEVFVAALLAIWTFAFMRIVIFKNT